jgi:hypothetical protein
LWRRHISGLLEVDFVGTKRTCYSSKECKIRLRGARTWAASHSPDGRIFGSMDRALAAPKVTVRRAAKTRTTCQIKGLRLCDYFQRGTMTRGSAWEPLSFLVFYQVFQKSSDLGHIGLCLMKNTFRYSLWAMGVLYTHDRGSGRGLSRGVRLVLIFAVLRYLKLKGRWESAPVNGVK